MSTDNAGTTNFAKDIWQKDNDHFTHPWQLFDSFPTEGSMIMDRAEGCYLIDIEGNRYLDSVGGLWCTNIGQGRDEMADAIADQVRQLAYASPFVDSTTAPAAQLASKLADLAPGDLSHVLFSCGGSTAIDSAYRLIQFYQNCRGLHEKKHIIARDGSYHGSTYVAMSIGGKKADHPPEFDYKRDDIHHISNPGFYYAKDAEAESEFLNFLVDELEQKILDLGADKVAAFFAEPIMGAGGVIVPPKGYHQRTHEICQKYDVLYVSDEVVTAFGRLLPLGATIYSDKIHQVIGEQGKDRCFTNGYTYSGHPVCCAAALKNIEIMERENIFENAKTVGDYFGEQLETLSDLAIVGEVRGYRLMQCVHFVANKQTREDFPPPIDIAKVISDLADAKGLMVRPIGNLNVMSPPLIITKDEVDFIVATLRICIIEAMDSLGYS